MDLINYTTAFRTGIPLTLPPIQPIQMAHPPAVKGPGRETDLFSPSSVDIRNAGNCKYSLGFNFMTWCPGPWFFILKTHSVPSYTILELHNFSYTILELRNFRVTQFQSYTILELHSFRVTQFQIYTILDLHNFRVTQFQSYTNLELSDFLKRRNLKNKVFENSRVFPCGNESALRSKVAEEYCWAIPLATGRQWCGRSGSSDLEFVFQPDSHARTQIIGSKEKGKSKDKVHPRTGHEGPEGKQKYSCTLSLTSTLNGVGRSTPRPSRFTPVKDPVPIVQEAG